MNDLRLERDTSKYVIAGQRVPSVTEILSIAGMIDFGGVDQNVLDAAAERGRLAHRVTALWDRGALSVAEDGLPDVYRPVQGYLEAYVQFREDLKAEPLLVEHSFVCRTYRYAGTLDRVFVLPGGKILVVDLKTGQIQADYVGLQTAGYQVGLQEGELRGRIYIERRALRLLPNGTYRLSKLDDRSDHADFIAAARCAHRKLRMGRVTLEEIVRAED